jgi:hypothetical protein
MKVDNVTGTGTLMEIVHVLSDHNHVETALQIGDGPMSSVRLGIRGMRSSLVVELQHKFGIAVPGIKSCDIFNSMIVPQTVAASKGWYSTRCADSRACEEHNLSRINLWFRHLAFV